MQFSTDPKLERPPKLSEQVAKFLSDEIAKNSSKTGENLPSEAELASRFNVSRVIIREALACLKFEGIIESRRGRKTRIARSDRRRLFRIEPSEKMDSYELEQLYEFRTILESAAAGLAAKRRSRNDLSKIKDCLDVLAETTQKGQRNLKANVEFHQLIAAASRNQYLKDFMQFLNNKIWEQIREVQEKRKLRNPMNDNKARLKVLREHKSIFDAIDKGDQKKARDAIIRHISNAAKGINITLDL